MTRRRVRRANAVLRRIAWQRARLADRYGSATSDAKRFAAVAEALIAAASPGSHQPDPEAATRALVNLTDQARAALDRLHDAQRSAAEKTLHTEEQRSTNARARTAA